MLNAACWLVEAGFWLLAAGCSEVDRSGAQWMDAKMSGPVSWTERGREL